MRKIWINGSTTEHDKMQIKIFFTQITVYLVAVYSVIINCFTVMYINLHFNEIMSK